MTKQEAILQVVRGEKPWQELESVGIHESIIGAKCEHSNPHGVSVAIGLPDGARGFLAHQDDPAAHREWALVMQALDVDPTWEGHPVEEQIGDAPWDAAFGESLSPETIELVRDLAQVSESKV